MQAWEEKDDKPVISSISHPYRLNRDDVEDEELDTAQIMEGMSMMINGFKDHPLYVLTRHLKQNEIIHPAPPATPQLGKFRGEPVYPRSSIVSLKTPENWLRSEGRVIKEGVQPLKSIKLRTSTVVWQRELEILREGLREAGQSQESEVMQGLYA
ncbi:Rad4 beta-hairpin domain 1-domain-containing protein [Mycena floridula]|nr:Rad4 beta-hairpin domain 1-domain-containing protein [Mycena floridula]